MSKRISFKISALRLLALGVLASGQPAAAQEDNPSTPGQIPDPSTYQGSTVLQQQSDQQDQSFRQQQEQQSQGYQQRYGSSGQSFGYSGNGGTARRSPASLCNSAMERAPSLAPLRGLVELGADSRDPRYFSIQRKATAAERPALKRWLAARHHCETVPNGFRPDVQAMNMRSGQITDRMILAVIDGRMTYGEFNYTRAHNAQVFENYRLSH